MRFTADSVASLADTIDAAPSSLLTTGNPKTAKGEGLGYLTAIMHLAPHKAAGFNVCASASAGCIAACLNTAGKGAGMSAVHISRIRKTKWFRQDKEAFMLQLCDDIRAHVRKSEREGFKPAVRLNGTSDIPWENVRFTNRNGFYGTIMENFPNVQFYDYTKVAIRFSRPLPANYDLTFSLAEDNDSAADFVLAKGGRVAVVFRNRQRPNQRTKDWNVQGTWNGRKVIDADATDLRFLDPRGVYCGLKAKGLATKDSTGFVRDIDPA